MNKAFKFIIGVGISVLFFWLAFNGISIDEVLDVAKDMEYGWILPFALVVLVAHFLRAERWRLLLSEEKERNRLTLFTGVMLAYMLNYAFPRLGEVTRPVYVARKEGDSSTKLIGTIVLERVVDMLSMIVLTVFVAIFLINDQEKLSQLVNTDILGADSSLLLLVIVGVVGLVLLAIVYFIIKKLAESNEKVDNLFQKIIALVKTFIDGVLAIRELKSWPLFVLYTLLIWVCYILMTFIPFWMFDLADTYHLDLVDALIITVIAAIGIIIPAPGGFGTYHLITQQALLILYSIPAATGFAYATINHATAMFLIIICTPILLFLDKYYSMKKE